MGYDGCSRLAFKKVGCIEFILPIVKEAEDGKLFIVVSAMAIAETLHLGTPGNAQDYQIISEFFDSKEVWEQAVDRAVAECARDIRRTHEITGADSLHVATGACRPARRFSLPTMAIRQRRERNQFSHSTIR